jgi:colanic acid/amylovoran biosynthesis protein
MNILIINLHSALNLGDEAILQQTITLLHKKYPGSTITLMANHPKSWNIIENVFIKPSLIHYVENFNSFFLKGLALIRVLISLLLRGNIKFFVKGQNELQAILTSLRSADLVLSAGGGNFYTNTIIGKDFILNVLLLFFAGLLNKTIVMLPQSFGPVRTKCQMKLLKGGLKFAKKIYVREAQSYEFLVRIGINPQVVQLIPDLALLSNCEPRKPNRKNETYKIGMTIINRGAQTKTFKFQESYQVAIIKFIHKIIEQTNAELFIFVQCYGPSQDQNDNLISTFIYNRFCEVSDRIHLLNEYKNSNDLLCDLAEMDIMIASRMHSAIFSLATNTPSILIGYQPKSKGLFDLFGLQKYFMDITEVNAEKLYSLSADLFSNYRNISDQEIAILHDVRSTILESMLTEKW